MLSIGDVARHWSVSTATVRVSICGGALRAVRVGGRYRTTWPDVWACEEGRRPGRHETAAYATPRCCHANSDRSQKVRGAMFSGGDTGGFAPDAEGFETVVAAALCRTAVAGRNEAIARG